MKNVKKQSELGEIPINWEIKELGDNEMFKIETGSTPKSEQKQYWDDGTVEWATPKDLIGKYLSNTERYITQEGLENSNVSLVPEGSIIVSTRAPIGLISIAKTEMTFNQGCKAIVVNDKDKIDNEYLYYSVLTTIPAMQKAGAGSTFMEISKENFEKIKLLLPPITEQRKIAEVLSTVDEAIALAEEKIQKTERLKKGMMQTLLTRGIGHTKFKKTELGDIPEEWEIVSYKDIIEITSGKTKPKDMVEVENGEMKYPVYGGNGINGYSKQYLIDKPVIVLGRVGEKCGNVFKTKGRSWVTDNALYTFSISDDCDVDFLEYSLRAIDLNNSKRESGQPLITQGIVYSKLLAKPPVDEQKRISNLMLENEEYLMLEKYRKEKLEYLKKGLMNGLLTGEKRVNI